MEIRSLTEVPSYMHFPRVSEKFLFMSTSSISLYILSARQQRVTLCLSDGVIYDVPEGLSSCGGTSYRRVSCYTKSCEVDGSPTASSTPYYSECLISCRRGERLTALNLPYTLLISSTTPRVLRTAVLIMF